MTFVIQEMSIQDYDGVRRLWEASEGIELSDIDSRESVSRFLERNPGLSFVAWKDDLVIGAVLCGHDGRRGYIDHLVVDMQHRREGIGRALVGRCLYNLMRIGIRKWHLFVLEDNQQAIAFWEKIGWAQRVELVLMSKPGQLG